jgi:KDO2-lipid IV(A) lauroyltransferase
MAALERGEPVGIVGDRDLTGGGMPVQLFGAPTSLPIGPALVAIETGAPTYGVLIRRATGGRFVGRLDPLPIPSGASRRERVAAFLEAEARWFERQVARAPEQWWAVFFPIWPDLEREAAR